ncbi:glycoside hydrolase domain-containing protein [Pedobacter africanus]|uniref:Glycoside hydrolase 123-like N-terminal domain-containing protein n=1 Tax=Pedobacter africanus TaxID=151894 RepID=A0A1W2BJQ3_9SPHI|nr:glycoside hydrolase domain-containing protein [Pedobacter africanus]SMC73113.1 hypothetical protein SAMN04488524_2417 [Pedobacter africanus]
MKKLLFSSLMLIASLVYAQNKDKLLHPIDIDAIRETKLTGYIGLNPTIMSKPAKPADVKSFIKRFPNKKYFTFPESRENPIRLLDSLPEKWTRYSAAEMNSFKGTAQPGEYYVFQVGVYTDALTLNNIKVNLSPLSGSGGQSIKDVTCFNTGGISFKGEKFSKSLQLSAKNVLPLWFGISIPEDYKGVYRGQIQIKPEGLPATTVEVSLNVNGNIIANHGYNDETKLSRLAWLNTKVALDDGITNGFKQVAREQKHISILGRTIQLSNEGLPIDIQTYFDKNNELILPKGEPIIAAPIRFIIEQNGKELALRPNALKFDDHFPASTHWETKLTSGEITVTVKGRADYDGFIGYSALVTASKDIAIDDIRLLVPMRPEKATYMMGLDKEGGFSPADWHWKWDVQEKHQDEVWMGAVNGGLKLKLKGKNYQRQLVNLYYPFGPLHEPESWGNGNKGGVDIYKQDKIVMIKAYSGKRILKKGETYQFDAEFLVTPFKLINKDIQFNDRYYHSDIDTTSNTIKLAQEHGANIINVHHKKDIYPFLDYPFANDNVPDLKAFIDSSHTKGFKTKIYYTTREISVNAPELWTMRALGDEIIYPGPGMATRTLVNPNGVHPWLGQNLKKDFIPGWVATFTSGKYKGRQDLAVLTRPDSRLNNFFLGGLEWMCKELNIDGIYMDDLALDRETMQRTRKILERDRPGAKIDMHTWNHYNKYAKWASSLNLYMDMLPYIDHLWVGEARDYNRSSDYWLIEVSGVPFGLSSQMLNKGGNPWRGMVFGITNRLGWFKAKTPEHIWKFWDDYHIERKQMIGFWNDDVPVKTDNKKTEATVYKGKDEVIIAVANWTSEPQKCKLNINWKALGLNPDQITAEIPAITDFQEKRKVNLDREIDLEGEKGFLIVIKRNQ